MIRIHNRLPRKQNVFNFPWYFLQAEEATPGNFQCLFASVNLSRDLKKKRVLSFAAVISLLGCKDAACISSAPRVITLIKFGLQDLIISYSLTLCRVTRVEEARCEHGTGICETLSAFISIPFRSASFVFTNSHIAWSNVTYCLPWLRPPLRFLIPPTKCRSWNFFALVRRGLISHVSIWACYRICNAISAIRRISNRC